MLYFRLNSDNFIGENIMLGDIKTLFFFELVSINTKAKYLQTVLSENICFFENPEINKKEWLLEEIDEESFKCKKDEVIKAIEVM